MSNFRDDARRDSSSCGASAIHKAASRVVRRLTGAAAAAEDDEAPPLSSHTPFEELAFPSGKAPAPVACVPGEIDRVRLIGELMSLLHEPSMPDDTRTAGLTLIGWLARRMPGEAPHTLGCDKSPSSSRTRVRPAIKSND